MCVAVCDNVELAEGGGGGIHAHSIIVTINEWGSRQAGTLNHCYNNTMGKRRGVVEYFVFFPPGLQSAFSDDQAVRIVVDMREADPDAHIVKCKQPKRSR